MQILIQGSRLQARMSAHQPTEPDLRYRGDLQKPFNCTQSKCEKISPIYAENQTNPTNPMSEQSPDKENMENNGQLPENNKHEDNVSFNDIGKCTPKIRFNLVNIYYTLPCCIYQTKDDLWATKTKK